MIPNQKTVSLKADDVMKYFDEVDTIQLSSRLSRRLVCLGQVFTKYGTGASQSRKFTFDQIIRTKIENKLKLSIENSLNVQYQGLWNTELGW